MKYIIKAIVIIGLIAAAVFIKGKYFPTTETNTVTVTKTDTIRDTTQIIKKLPAPDPDTIIQVDTVKMPDSSNIFEQYAMLYQKYHRQNVYNPVLKDDTSAYISLNFIVSQNKVQDSMDFTFKNRRPTVINKTINKTVVSQSKFFVGADFSLNTLQPSIMYKSKKDILYKVGYDFHKPKGIRLGVYTSFQNVFQ
jgi:hypothetical protein